MFARKLVKRYQMSSLSYKKDKATNCGWLGTGEAEDKRRDYCCNHITSRFFKQVELYHNEMII